MFNKSLSEINFQDVETFCHSYSEGVRVEYKSVMVENIPKTISAFANTLGGIIVVGVTTEPIHNKVIKIGGVVAQKGIEEAVINSSLNGIYPSIFPEIKVLELPESKNVLIIIKVHESTEAPHAIQNTTRVYIRTGSVSQPYELAEIDRIKYLLERRGSSTKLKEQLIKSAKMRCDQFLGNAIVNRTRLAISVSPVFPYQPIISLDRLYDFCNLHHPATIKHYSLHDPQNIMDGVIKVFGSPNNLTYREINHYGLIFIKEDLPKGKSQWTSIKREGEPEKSYLRLTEFILGITKTIKLAESFYEYCGYRGNIEIKVNVENIFGEFLMFSDDGFADIDSTKATDNVAYSSQICAIEDIKLKSADVVTFLLKNILWVFNCRINPKNRVDVVFKDNQIQ